MLHRFYFAFMQYITAVQHQEIAINGVLFGGSLIFCWLVTVGDAQRFLVAIWLGLLLLLLLAKRPL